MRRRRRAAKSNLHAETINRLEHQNECHEFTRKLFIFNEVGVGKFARYSAPFQAISQRIGLLAK